MTQEEKAKAYDEALEDMRVIYPNLKGNAKLAVEHAFPQLHESEDERIRKWLVDYFSSIKKTVWIHRDITCEQILDWLEKQKEPENTSASTMVPSCWEVEHKHAWSEAVKWLVDEDYDELTEKGRFLLGSVGIGYNGYYIPYGDLLKLPKEGER